MPDLTLSSAMDAFLAQSATANQKATIVGSINAAPSSDLMALTLVIQDDDTFKSYVGDIGSNAFYEATITNVSIGNSVTNIGNYAFSGCSAITSVTIPNSVTSIGYAAFYYCTGLTSVTIPNSVTSIGSSAFNSCSGLTSVTIPDSVTSIGDYTFAYCYSLTSLTIGSSVTNIGNGAFSYSSNLNTLNCYVIKEVINAGVAILYNTAAPFTIHARSTDATWTAGLTMIGATNPKQVNVIKDL